MSEAQFDAEAYVERMAEVIGLDIRPEWRGNVVQQIANTARLAGTVLAFPLDDRIEPAPVFEA